MRPSFHVALLLETSTSWGAHVVRGVAEYARRFGPWLLDLEPRGRYEQLLLPKRWNGDGVIARVTNPTLSEQIRRFRLPAVNVSWYPYCGPTLARCIIDERACAELAVRHFVECGLRELGYLPAAGRPDVSDPLGPAFRKKAAEAGIETHHYAAETAASPHRQLVHLRRWVTGLPKPVGILAFTDIEGRMIANVCRAVGLRVPEDVAILGREHDELICAVSDPPLSSLEYPPLRVGFEAARLLHRMLEGEPSPHEPIRIAPLGVITRKSTDTLAVKDTVVAQAILFIREEFRRSIQVEDVVREVGVSRRALEQRCRAVLGRSPAAELRRVRLLEAQRLLADSDTPIEKIAAQPGFKHAEVLFRAFHRAFGVSPSAYRRRNVIREICAD